tara:strand:- start:8370 stop:10346 length:1977 start_codon:yes stop_codon:yes gene_type:complete
MQSFAEYKLLLEKDLRPKIKKFLTTKFGEDPANKIADFAHSISDKQSIVIANIIANTIVEKYKTRDVDISSPTPPTDWEQHVLDYLEVLPVSLSAVATLLKIQKKPTGIDFKTLTYDKAKTLAVHTYPHISRWIEESGEFTPDVTWDEAMDKADEWYSKEATNVSLKEGEEMVLGVFDGEDYIDIEGTKHFWADLNKKSSSTEIACGTCDLGTLFSFRTASGEVKMSADIDKDAPISGQIYAQANTKPKKKYHRAILYLLGHLGIEKVKTRSYGEESFNPNNDLSYEDKKWYNEEFDLDIKTGGVSDAEIAEAEEVFDDFNNEAKYVRVDCEFNEEYFSPNVSVCYDYSDYELADDGWQESNRKNHDAYKEIFGYDFQESYNGSICVDVNEGMDYGASYFNPETDDDVVEWAGRVVSDAEYYEREAEGEWSSKLGEMIAAGLVEEPIENLTLTYLSVSMDDEDEEDKVLVDGRRVDFGHVKFSNPEFVTKSGQSPERIVTIWADIDVSKTLPKFSKKVNTNRARQIYTKLSQDLNKSNFIDKWIASNGKNDDVNQLKFDFYDDDLSMAEEASDPAAMKKQGWVFYFDFPRFGHYDTHNAASWSPVLKLKCYTDLDTDPKNKRLLEAAVVEENYYHLVGTINTVIYSWVGQRQRAKQSR